LMLILNECLAQNQQWHSAGTVPTSPLDLSDTDSVTDFYPPSLIAPSF
jgi:hypothetical protein